MSRFTFEFDCFHAVEAVSLSYICTGIVEVFYTKYGLLHKLIIGPRFEQEMYLVPACKACMVLWKSFLKFQEILVL